MVYPGIFFAGGNGTIWDLRDDENVQKVAASIYEQGGVVAAVDIAQLVPLIVKSEERW